MVGRGGGRVVAVVGSQNDQIVSRHAGLEPGDPGVELPQSFMKPRDVVAVPPALVEFDHVHEDEAGPGLLERPLDQPIRVAVGGGVLAGDVPAREQVVHLANPDAWHPRRGQSIEQRLVHRGDREIPSARRTLVRPGPAGEWPRDHAAHGVLAHQHVARRRTRPVQLLERHRPLVRRHLEDRVGGRVDDPLAGPLVLFSELRDDLRARRRLVPQPTPPGPSRELVQELSWEPLRVGPERLGQEHAADLPMPGGRVLTLRRRKGDTVCRRRPYPGRQPGDAPTHSQSQPLQVRQPQPPHPPRNIAERVRARIAVGRLVGTRADPEPVEHDDRCALQS